jgi:ABC-type sugar transport system ATPase subunit
VKVGVRPHDLHSNEESPARCTIRIPVTVDLLEHTGSELFVVGGAARDNTLMARFHRSTPVTVGDQVVFTLDPADLHVFGSEGVTIFASADVSAGSAAGAMTSVATDSAVQ